MTRPASERTSRPEPLPPGHCLRGRYRIQRVLGHGGQCYVYLAADEASDEQTVVVKNMIHHSLDPRVRREEYELFSQEAAILGQVTHPGLPVLVEAFSEGDAHYVVEQYVGNLDLDHLLQMRGGRLHEAEVAWLAHQMLDLLCCVHALPQPVVLKDIKPSNITCVVDGRGSISPDYRGYFIDLTIAKRHEDGVADTKRMGSVGYSPPEQYRGWSQPRSDLYALAATLHQALTGHDPVHTPFAMPDVAVLAPALRPGWTPFLRRALALQVGSRYADAREMRQSLETFYPREEADEAVRRLAVEPRGGLAGRALNTLSRARAAAVLALVSGLVALLLAIFGGAPPRLRPEGMILEALSVLWTISLTGGTP